MDIKDANEKMYGIRQPAIDENYVLNKNEIDLMFVPAVAFDLHGYRMGYGKGYYDRWLGNVDIDRTVGLAFDCQIAEKLPIGKYDIPVGMIITERRIAETKKLIEQRGGNG
jgi:5-formyltetrahydrofolate cyclo-ligase